MVTITELQKKAKTIRKEIITMLNAAGSGHTGGSLGMTDIFTALYFEILKHNPKKPQWKDRDYVFLSNGHICPVWYATLAEAKYFPKKELLKLRKIDSLLQGHPHNTTIPGVENSGGPLAQGLSMAVGAALALQTENKENTVFALTGDGELNEGQCWEAIMTAAKYQLSNLIIIVDRNNIQLDGPTESIMPMKNLRERFQSFGCLTYEMDGNNMSEIIKIIKQIKPRKKGPKVIVANTVPGKGVSFMENDYRWHGVAPNDEQMKKALEELQ